MVFVSASVGVDRRSESDVRSRAPTRTARFCRRSAYRHTVACTMCHHYTSRSEATDEESESESELFADVEEPSVEYELDRESEEAPTPGDD